MFIRLENDFKLVCFIARKNCVGVLTDHILHENCFDAYFV